MVESLIISGVPGSGKSAIAKYTVENFNEYFKKSGLQADHMSDYDILYKKFLDEEQCQLLELKRRFHRVVPDRSYVSDRELPDGFYVSDRAVYDEALTELSEKIDTISSRETTLVVVEFARSDFMNALKQFNDDFLKRSSYLFLNADIATCKDRVQKRIEREYPLRTLDDHYVSDHTFEFYQDKDNEDYLIRLRSKLVSTYGIEFSNISIIDSNGSWDTTVSQVDEVLKPLFASFPVPVPALA